MKLSLEGRHLDREHPLPEYPTPQFQRDSFICLNGQWDFQMDSSRSLPNEYSDHIIVPFAVETPLSEVYKRITPEAVLHYRRSIVIPAGFNRGRILLHFEAVDQICDVYLNGVKICHHEGGYLPFTVDLMELHSGENCLQVEVTDDTSSSLYPRGKQMDQNGGIWYTPTSGIWQSVWLESVPQQVIRSLKLSPDYDSKTLFIHADFEGKIEKGSAEVSHNGRLIASFPLDEHGNGSVNLRGSFQPWSPSNPFLYDLKVKINEDTVTSYFAMRKIGTMMVQGHRVFALNDQPLFLSGLLDQGYFPGGGLTPPSDQAIINDLRLAKDMGFNLIRKHIKIEPMRWYYHCDRLGLLVIQDFVNGGAPYRKRLIYLAPFIKFHLDDTKPRIIKDLGRIDPKSRANFTEDVARTVKRLYNCPCVCAWTLFNEGWGQFDTAANLESLRSLDPTRLVDANSGWFDQGVGDFASHHVYFKKIRLKNDGKRLLFLSEFGGYSLRVKDHVFSARNFGYKRFLRGDDLTKGLYDLYIHQVAPLIAKEGLSGCVLTQLSDVEEETNGLVTYDREIVKVDPGTFRLINSKLTF
jgi:beta-galactosidase/beta-glucuronidase